MALKKYTYKKGGKKEMCMQNLKLDSTARHFAIDRLQRGCVEQPSSHSPWFYAISWELRKPGRAKKIVHRLGTYIIL